MSDRTRFKRPSQHADLIARLEKLSGHRLAFVAAHDCLIGSLNIPPDDAEAHEILTIDAKGDVLAQVSSELKRVARIYRDVAAKFDAQVMLAEIDAQIAGGKAVTLASH